MISAHSLQLLQKHNFEVRQTDTYFEVIHRKAINWVWPFFSIALGVIAIPLITFGNFKLGLLVILLLIYPVYQLIQDLKQPKKLSIDSNSRKIAIVTKNHNSSIFSFNEVESIILNTFDEHLEPNPFREEVLVSHYYVELKLTDGSNYTAMTFKEADQHVLGNFITELEKLLAQQTSVSKKVKA